MPEKCIHGLDTRFCSICRQADDRALLPVQPLRVTSDGHIVVVLRLLPEGAKIFQLGDSVGLRVVDVQDLRVLADSSAALVDKKRFVQEAAERGYLFLPSHPLTHREQTDVGPTHCYHCKVILSLETGALGCKQCQYYVCGCGRCLCGYTATNWMGQLFSQHPELPITREDRVEYIRIFRSFQAA
jgi:hypothetical protein